MLHDLSDLVNVGFQMNREAILLELGVEVFDLVGSSDAVVDS